MLCVSPVWRYPLTLPDFLSINCSFVPIPLTWLPIFWPESQYCITDTRSTEHYSAGHIPGAISFPHRTMNASSTASPDRQTSHVCYCDGIGCNGSTRGAHKLAARWDFRSKS